MVSHTVVQDLITLGAIVGAIISWLVQLRWSQRYISARNAEAEAKDAQIASLETANRLQKDMSPVTLKENLDATREMLEGVIADLRSELAETRAALAAKEQEFEQLNGGISSDDERDAAAIRAARALLEAESQSLAEQMERVESQQQAAMDAVRVITELELNPALDDQWLSGRLLPLARGSAQMGHITQLPYPPVDGLPKRYASLAYGSGGIESDDGQQYVFNLDDLAEGVSPESLKTNQRVAFVPDNRPLHFGRARFVRPQERASST